MKIRQPIVTVAGHVDHGKTSILDCIRGSCVAEGEAGGITQKISFTLFPAEKIKECEVIKKNKIKVEIPGFLFVDTPGHAAFTNLRKRGGSLADLAILVIDINEGIMPQTVEVIKILKDNKTPFIIALNKIDCISGWRKLSDNLKESVDKQAQHARQDFDQKLFTFIGSLYSHSFEADLFYNVKDFSKKVALVPCSAKTGEGVYELLMVLCGLSQKFLKDRLTLGKEAKGVILEIKKEKAIEHIEAILYDGLLSLKDEIAIASFDEPIITKIRSLQEILPLSARFKAMKSVKAVSGIRMQVVEKKEILPGMPFQIYKDNLNEIKKQFKKEISESIKTDKKGIIVKADSLGSLEALISLLKQDKIKILKVAIGNINKSDFISAKANLEIEPLDAVILGFNVSLSEDVEQDLAKIDKRKEIKIISDSVIYKLIENLQEFRQEKKKEIEREKILRLTSICKLEILQNYVFRNSKPAIFGVCVMAGKLIPRVSLIDEDNNKVARVKNIQSEGSSIQEAASKQEVAISLPGVTFDRQLKNKKFLYSELSETQFREFKKNKELLSSEEISVLQEIAKIKRREKVTWGV